MMETVVINNAVMPTYYSSKDVRFVYTTTANGIDILSYDIGNTQCRMVLVIHYFVFYFSFIVFCLLCYFAIFHLVHDVETIVHLPQLLTTPDQIKKQQRILFLKNSKN